MENTAAMSHGVILENRKKLNITGVRDVISFDEDTIQLNTALGRMTIKGEGLHILGFNTETGDLTAEGKIHALAYSSQSSQEGFLSRLFR